MYGEDPYIVHLDLVVAKLAEYGFNDQTWVDAAYGHDLFDDTTADPYRYAVLFGATASVIALAVQSRGPNRKTRNEIVYKQLLEWPRDDAHHPAILKVADRIVNSSRGGLVGMYRKEMPGFTHNLKHLVPAAMWAELEANLGTQA